MKLHSKITLTLLISTLFIHTGCVAELLNGNGETNSTTEEKPNALVSFVDGFIGDAMERVQNKADNAEVLTQQSLVLQQQKLERKKESILNKGLGEDSKYNLKGAK